MDSTSLANRGEGLTLRRAALVAGFGYLFGPVTYAEFSIYPKLVIPTNIEQTVQNIAGHQGLFAASSAIPHGNTAQSGMKPLLRAFADLLFRCSGVVLNVFFNGEHPTARVAWSGF